MIMSLEYEQKKVRFCKKCGEQIPKSKWTSWKQYSTRKYCGRICVKGMSNKSGLGKDLAISEYIALNSRNGRLMADFNLGVLKAVEKIGNDIDSASGSVEPLDRRVEKSRGIICTYKGVPVTGEVVKTANQWLMDNWMGKAGQRNAPADIDNRNAGEKLVEMEFILRELGYKMVKIDE